MDSLSNDILSLILTKVKSGDSGSIDILACLRVNKTWHRLASPILHRHVVLDNSRMIPLHHSFRLDYGPQVQTLTLLVSSEGRHLVDGNPKPLPELDAKIRLVIPLLRRLDSLDSFSLSLEGREECIIERGTVVDIIDALPESCTNLELDTQGQDQQHGEGSAHLCKSLRRLMPRMHHVRIRVASVCPALLGMGELSNHHDLSQQSPLIDSTPETASPARTPFKPVDLPNIRSLVIYCALPHSGKMACCGRASRSHQTEYTGPSWVPITTAMEQLPVAFRPPPRGASILAVNATRQISEADFEDPAAWQAIVVARPMERTSQAVPHRAIWSSADSVFVRLPDGRDMVTTLGNAVLIAEGETWCGTLGGGARVPRTILEADAGADGEWRASFAVGLVRAPLSPLMTAAQWREEFPRRTSQLFRNEAMVGQRLLEVETRQGEGRYLAVDPVAERTPQGYARNFLGALRKVEAETNDSTVTI